METLRTFTGRHRHLHSQFPADGVAGILTLPEDGNTDLPGAGVHASKVERIVFRASLGLIRLRS